MARNAARATARIMRDSESLLWAFGAGAIQEIRRELGYAWRVRALDPVTTVWLFVRQVLEEYVESKSASGQFRTREEFAEEAARVFRDLEASHARMKTDIQAAIDEANRGLSQDMDFDAIKAELIGEFGEAAEQGRRPWRHKRGNPETRRKRKPKPPRHRSTLPWM